MGLFSKRNAEPLQYQAADRVIHVPASRDAVVAHLAGYSGLWSPKRAEEHELSIGEVGGWTAIRLPQVLHPWQLHNLAFWMLDCPGVEDQTQVIAASSATPDHPAYRLVRDPDVPDALCGWDEAGVGWTVHVPDNDIVRGEDVPVAHALTIPSGHLDWRSVPVLLEDPGRGMNERNESNAKSRHALRDSIQFVF